MLQGQDVLEVWPGDVNNNGIVNEVDVLFWSVAVGESGPRAVGGPSSEWAARLVEAWDGIIPGSGGLNLALADCNGNGQISNSDLQVIRRNFGQKRGQNEADRFTTGDSRIHPLLSYRFPAEEDDDDDDDEGRRLEMEVVLGDNGIEVNEFYGLAFTILYDPDLTGPDDEKVDFEPAERSWMGRLNSEFRHWSYNDSQRGRIHNVLYRRRNRGAVSQPDREAGEAESIGTFSIIIVEDIVSGLERVSLGFENVRLIDASLEEQLLAIDNMTIEKIEEEFTTSNPVLERINRQILVYPNPAHDWLRVSWTGEGYPLQRAELFNALGQRLDQFEIPAGNAQLDIPTAALSPGTYLIRIHTEAGPVSRLIVRE